MHTFLKKAVEIIIVPVDGPVFKKASLKKKSIVLIDRYFQKSMLLYFLKHIGRLMMQHSFNKEGINEISIVAYEIINSYKERLGIVKQ